MTSGDKFNSNIQSQYSTHRPNAGETKTVILLRASDGKVHRFDKDRIVLGAVGTADIRLSGEGVAPIHAVIEAQESRSLFTIYDLASETGLFINGKKVVTQILKINDQITMGRVTLQFSTETLTSTSPKDRYRESGGHKLFLDTTEDTSPLLLQEERDIQQIFDYRSTAKQALEVVMSWNDVILDVKHFVQKKHVSLGQKRNDDFIIPPSLQGGRFLLADYASGSYTIHLSQTMTGVLQQQGRLQKIEDVYHKNPLLTLNKSDFVKISIGDIDFYLSYSSAPPQLKLSKLFERDPLFLKIFSTSLVLTGLMVFSLMNVKVNQTIEAEQIPERIATILYNPQKFLPKVQPPVVKHTPAPHVTPSETKTPLPKPKPTAKINVEPTQKKPPKEVPKEMNVGDKKPKPAAEKPKSQGQAKEGAGVKAKGKEGTRGSQQAGKVSQAPPQNVALRPSSAAGVGRGGGNSQVEDFGNVDFLKGAGGKIENILAGTSARLGKSGERLKGFGGFNTLGNGGLALSGTGSGGGGTAEGLGGLTDQGRGGGRVGTGLGASGSGSGIIGGQARVMIRSGGPEETVVMGAIDADAVEAAINAHKDEFRLCYEREINAQTPNLAGRVGTSFVIGSSGKVTQAGIASTTLKHAGVEGCVIKVIKRIQFPIPRGAGVVQVTFPFKFSPIGKT